jgi:hypothetical protein
MDINYMYRRKKNDETKLNAVDNDKYAKIEKLGKLKEQGFITNEEFLEQKKKLLSQ